MSLAMLGVKNSAKCVTNQFYSDREQNLLPLKIWVCICEATEKQKLLDLPKMSK
jgi:hypothetical protein